MATESLEPAHVLVGVRTPAHSITTFCDREPRAHTYQNAPAGEVYGTCGAPDGFRMTLAVGEVHRTVTPVAGLLRGDRTDLGVTPQYIDERKNDVLGELDIRINKQQKFAGL